MMTEDLKSNRAHKLFCTEHLGYGFNHGGTKAAADATRIAVSLGAVPIAFNAPKRFSNPILNKLSAAFTGIANWLRVARMAHRGDWVLVQHPHEFITVGSRFIDALKRRGVNFAVLIHDFQALRFPEAVGEGERERVILSKFDRIICLNDVMKDYMVRSGYDGSIIECLYVWDYLCDGHAELPRGKGKDIVIAGNLSREKAGYLYKAAELPLRLELYGPNFSSEALLDSMSYHGEYAPDQLPGELAGAFALVWDGDELETCTGNFGEYLRYNTPHKFSLAMAAGLPVIVWEQAAIAGYVKERRVGLTVSSCYDVADAIDALTEEEYKVMLENARFIGEQLKNGEFLTAALRRSGLIE